MSERKRHHNHHHSHKKNVENLEFTVKRRGKTIGGLYWAIQNLISHNPNARPMNRDGIKDYGDYLSKELDIATENIIRSQIEKGLNQLAIPSNFNCNTCYCDFNDEKRPIALSCGHVICSDDLIAYADDFQKLACPSCDAEYELICPLYV
jgi:hypothetical protein